MDLYLVLLTLFLGVLAFCLIGKQCHHRPSHKIYDSPPESKKTPNDTK